MGANQFAKPADFSAACVKVGRRLGERETDDRGVDGCQERTHAATFALPVPPHVEQSATHSAPYVEMGAGRPSAVP